jgi:hypothetical protein
MTRSQYDKFMDIIRLSRLQFADDPATLAKLDAVEQEAKALNTTKEASHD